MFSYVTFRAIFALVMSLVVSCWFGSHFIDMLKKRNISETQRDVKLDPFGVTKKGVPTMGGVIIIVAILLPCILIGDLKNVYMWLMLITTVILGVIGFADDYIKTFRGNKDGLNGWLKVTGQLALGLIVGLTLRYSPQVVINEKVETRIENNTEIVVKTPDVKSTRTTIPFFKNHNLNYSDMFGWLGESNKYKAGWIFFVLLTLFVVTAVSNGSNLNDGMDGMAAGNSAIIGVTLGILAYVSSNVVTASHFDLMYVPGSQEVVVYLAAFVGALIGFLWFNSYPRFYYKLGKRKGVHQRIWKRTPIHDHYRTSMEQVLKADPTSTVRFHGNDNKLQFETKITLRTWIISIGLAALTILTLKIR